MNTNYKSITTWEHVCNALNVDRSAQGDLAPVPGALQPFVLASARLAMIVQAINGDWKPDWNNSNQRKWWGWFWMDSPGFRFFDSSYTCSYTRTTGGSRLCFETEEQLQHAVKHFLPCFKAFYTS